MSDSNPLIIVLGPTASGKTKLAVRLAQQLHSEIISADSRQVFRDMNIGTGKDLSEYVIGGHQIAYHLIDIKASGEKYNVNEFKEDFYQVFEDLTKKKILPILCGGTGMYIHSLLQNQAYTAIPNDAALRAELEIMGIDALRLKLSHYPVEFTGHADLSSHKRLIRAIEVAEFLSYHELPYLQRPKIDPIIIGLDPGISLRKSRIIDRLNDRLAHGLVTEVEQLIEQGLTPEMLDYYGLEYRFVGEYLNGTYTFSELKERLGIAICQFSKRQMTFFRKMEKDGVKINWFPVDGNDNELYSNALSLVENSLLV